jgi:hypothetical protein
MPIPAYRAKQSTNTTGTATVVLNAAETNARNFSAAYGASSRRILYMIQWATGFELGLGDFDGGTPGSLTRATVLASSNAGALVTLPAGTKDVFAVFDPAAREVISISGTATLALADLGNAVVFTGASAATLNLPAVATAPLGAGWLVINSGTAALTIDPSDAETVNGAATLVLQAGQAAMILRVSGAGWLALMGATSATAAHDLLTAPWVDLASAGTSDIGAANSANVRITGTTTITALGTALSGVTRHLRFAAALTLTHNATSLILPGSANITTAAGDTAIAISLGSGNWVVVNYQPAGGYARAGAATASGFTLVTARVLGRLSSGTGAIEEIPIANPVAAFSIGINRGVEISLPSANSVALTGIPIGVRRIGLTFIGMSTNGTQPILIQPNSSSGTYVSGLCKVSREGASSIATSFLNAVAAITVSAATNVITGQIVLVPHNDTTWSALGGGLVESGNNGWSTAGYCTTNSTPPVDRLNLLFQGGTNLFTGGLVRLWWSF